MPILRLAPIWLTIVVMGLAALFFHRLRHVSAYLILGPTSGFIAAMVFFSAEKFSIIRPILWASGIAKSNHHSHAIVIGTFLGFEIGGALGVFVGTILAHKINQRLGW